MTMLKAIAAVVLCFATASAAIPQASKRPAARDPEVIDAKEYQKLVQSYQGKPLLVTFWATWCEPCRDEFPMLNELKKQYTTQGLQVVGVNLDDDGDLILMRRFLVKYKPAFLNYRKKAGAESAFVKAVLPGWSGAIPASFSYAKDARQIGHLLGANNRETYEAAIRMLLTSGNGSDAAPQTK